MFKHKYRVDLLEVGKLGSRLQSGPIFKIDRPSIKKFISTTAFKFRYEWNKLPTNERVIDDQMHFNMVIKQYFVSTGLFGRKYVNIMLV